MIQERFVAEKRGGSEEGDPLGTLQGTEEDLERFRETPQPETEKSILSYIVKQARLFFKRV